jgi:KDO2-lipid IV(A) lauroyltransferase
MPRRKRLKRYAVYLSARVVAALWILLPFSFALALGEIVGVIAYLIDGGDRRRAIAQMEQALGLTRDEARAKTRALFRHLGIVVAEIVLLPRIDLESYVSLSADATALLRRLLDRGRGVILVSAHLGNWELLAQRLVHAGFPGATISRENPNPYLGQWLVSRRALGGLESIDRGDPSSARKILSVLKSGAVLGFLIDQDTRVQSTFVPFFGRPAATPIAPAQLALRREIPVAAAFIYRRPAGGHEIHVEEVHLEGVSEPNEATAKMTEAIERAIRRAPEQWVWFHRRWKTVSETSTEPSHG